MLSQIIDKQNDFLESFSERKYHPSFSFQENQQSLESVLKYTISQCIFDLKKVTGSFFSKLVAEDAAQDKGSQLSQLNPFNKNIQDRPQSFPEINIHLLRTLFAESKFADFYSLMGIVEERNAEFTNELEVMLFEGCMNSDDGALSIAVLHHFLQRRDEVFDFCRDFEAPKDVGVAVTACGLGLAGIETEGALCHEFWKHVFVISGDTVSFFKKNKVSRVSKRPLSDFVDPALPLRAVTSSSDTFYFAQQQDESTILVTIFRDSLIGKKSRRSIQQINVKQPIDRVSSAPKQFFVFMKSGEMLRVDLDGAHVKTSASAYGSVFNLDRCSANDTDFVSGLAEGGRVSMRKYPRIAVAQIVPKQFPGNSAYYAITELSDRILQGATRRILQLAGKKENDPKAVFDNSLTSASFDTIVVIVQSLECIILSTVPAEVRVHTLTALIRALALNLSCFSTSKTPLEPFLVKRIQKILMNVPLCTPTYDSLFMFLRIVVCDVYTSSKFVNSVFSRFRGKDLIAKIDGAQSVFIVSRSLFEGKREKKVEKWRKNIRK